MLEIIRSIVQWSGTGPCLYIWIENYLYILCKSNVVFKFGDDTNLRVSENFEVSIKDVFKRYLLTDRQFYLKILTRQCWAKFLTGLKAHYLNLGDGCHFLFAQKTLAGWYFGSSAWALIDEKWFGEVICFLRLHVLQLFDL